MITIATWVLFAGGLYLIVDGLCYGPVRRWLNKRVP